MDMSFWRPCLSFDCLVQSSQNSSHAVMGFLRVLSEFRSWTLVVRPYRVWPGLCTPWWLCTFWFSESPLPFLIFYLYSIYVYALSALLTGVFEWMKGIFQEWGRDYPILLMPIKSLIECIYSKTPRDPACYISVTKVTPVSKVTVFAKWVPPLEKVQPHAPTCTWVTQLLYIQYFDIYLGFPVITFNICIIKNNSGSEHWFGCTKSRSNPVGCQIRTCDPPYWIGTRTQPPGAEVSWK